MKTSHLPFFSCNPNKYSLFAVQAGIPVMDAMEAASCFLDSASALAYQLAGNGEGQSRQIYAIANMIDMAKAALDASICGMMREASGHPLQD